MTEDHSEKEQTVSNFRQSLEELKQSDQWDTLPDEAKAELEKAVDDLEFTIQTEYDDAKGFVMAALGEEGEFPIEDILDDDALAPMAAKLIENTAAMFRTMMVHHNKDLMARAIHMGQAHDVNVEAFFHVLKEFTRTLMVVDYVIQDMLGSDMGSISFGVALVDDFDGTDESITFLNRPSEEDES